MSEAKRIRNEKLHALLAEFRRREEQEATDNPRTTLWAVYATCSDMLQTVLNYSADELDARPITVALPKFRPGHSVWTAERKNIKVQCPACAGTGKFTGQDGEAYVCGKCHGDEHIYDHIEYRPRQLAVHKVGMFLTSGGTCEVETLYSLAMGGKSMGTYDNIQEYRLHATEDECRVTCERMNAGEWGPAI